MNMKTFLFETQQILKKPNANKIEKKDCRA